jgi:aldehyde dehydrogenase (NAD+)
VTSEPRQASPAPPSSEEVGFDPGRDAAELRAAFHDRPLRTLRARRDALRALDRLLVDGEEAIVSALRADMGRGRYEAWAGEIAPIRAEIHHASRRLGRWLKGRRTALPLALLPGSARVRPQPRGVVLILGPWNYPVQLLLKPLVSALAAGNHALLKPSEHAPVSARALADLVREHMDPTLVRVVLGGAETAAALCRMPMDHIHFTGGTAVGRRVMAAAAENLVPVTLELGGKSPCIVDAGADLRACARRIVWGRFLNAGQTCVAPDHVLVHERVCDALLAALKEELVRSFGSDPRVSPDYGRIVNRQHLMRLRRLLDGCQVVAGGECAEEELYLAPTIVWNPDLESALMNEEIFGPILPVSPVPNLDAAIGRAAAGPSPLAVYLFTRETAAISLVEAGTRSGALVVNDVVIQAMSPKLPFGGVGESGMGVAQGYDGFLSFSHQRAVVRRSTRFDPLMRYPPYDQRKLRWARRLLAP